MKIPFVGGAYETFSKNLNAQQCINFFPHLDQEGGTEKLVLRNFPGLLEWIDFGVNGEMRGALVMGDYLYVVFGKKVYRINDSGFYEECSRELYTASGRLTPTQMAHNGSTMVIVDGQKGYYITGTTLEWIDDDAFPIKPLSVAQHDTYFLVNYEDSGRAYISSDGINWDGTMYFNDQSRPDNTLALISDHDDLFMVGAKHIKAWYNSGATVPFDEKPGTGQEIGIGARQSLIRHDNSIFFMTDKFQVVRLDGYTPSPISTRSLEYQFAQYSAPEEAFAMTVNIQGNAFYILTFPTDNATWCYNAASGLWNRLCSYPYPYDNRWRGNCCEYFAGKYIVGDYQNGKLYELDFETYQDNGEIIKRVRVSPAIRKDGKRIFWFSFELFIEAGVGLDGDGQGSDPMISLEYSDDSGHTWSSEIWRSMGKIGEYKRRVRWNRLGSSQNRIIRTTITDPVKCIILGANLEGEIGTA